MRKFPQPLVKQRGADQDDLRGALEFLHEGKRAHGVLGGVDGPRLADHVARQLAERGWDEMVSIERAGFPNPVLGAFDGELIRLILADERRWRDGVARLPLRSKQEEFELSHAAVESPQVQPKLPFRRLQSPDIQSVQNVT